MLTDDDGSSPVTHNMGTRGLNYIQILGIVGEKVQQEVPAFGMIEVEVQTPMEKPSPLLQRLKIKQIA